MVVQAILRPVSLKEANQQFSRLIRDVENGEGFVITRRGRPVARILPNDETRTRDPQWVAAYEANERRGSAWGCRWAAWRIEDRAAVHDRDEEFSRGEMNTHERSAPLFARFQHPRVCRGSGRGRVSA